MPTILQIFQLQILVTQVDLMEMIMEMEIKMDGKKQHLKQQRSDLVQPAFIISTKSTKNTKSQKKAPGVIENRGAHEVIEDQEAKAHKVIENQEAEAHEVIEDQEAEADGVIENQKVSKEIGNIKVAEAVEKHENLRRGVANKSLKNGVCNNTRCRQQRHETQAPKRHE